MSRLSKYLSLSILIVFILACSTVTQPIEDVQNLAGTVQSFATALPVETLKALASQIPVETLKALASQIPVETLQALPSEMPNFEGYFDPQGTPVSEWNGIPIIPQATAGQEFPDTNTYSIKVSSTMSETQDFYNAQLASLGWSSLFNSPTETNGSVNVFQKDEAFLTVTIMEVDGSVLVILTLA